MNQQIPVITFRFFYSISSCIYFLGSLSFVFNVHQPRNTATHTTHVMMLTNTSQFLMGFVLHQLVLWPTRPVMIARILKK